MAINSFVTDQTERFFRRVGDKGSMYCPKCGGEVEEKVDYCPHCGHQIKSGGKKFVDDAARVTGEVIEGAVDVTEEVYHKTKPVVKDAAKKTKGFAKGVAKKLKGEEEKD